MCIYLSVYICIYDCICVLHFVFVEYLFMFEVKDTGKHKVKVQNYVAGYIKWKKVDIFTLF